MDWGPIIEQAIGLAATTLLALASVAVGYLTRWLRARASIESTARDLHAVRTAIDATDQRWRGRDADSALMLQEAIDAAIRNGARKRKPAVADQIEAEIGRRKSVRPPPIQEGPQ